MLLPSMEFNQNRWNRLLLNGFWIVFAIVCGVEILYMLYVTELPRQQFLMAYIVRPGIWMALIVLGAEASIRQLPHKFHDYFLLSASALLAAVLTAIHSTVDYLLFFLFFPIMISIFYFQYKKLLYAIGNSFAALYALYFSIENIHERISLIGLLSMTVLLAVYSIIAFGVLTRGREITHHLRSSYESNQELLVRNIMMDKLAKTDALTDTYNHMAYHEFVDKLVEQAENGSLSLHIAVMDIDNFKQVNDTYGHRAGDAVLREVAAIARSKVGPHDFVARYGGEEFVILFTESDDATTFETAESIRRAIAETRHESLHGMAVSVSIGLNRYVPGMGKEHFFHGADTALYEAKHTGKNRTLTFETMSGMTPASAAARHA